MMSHKIFISYRHNRQAWVLEKLLPCLEAGGLEVLIDRERSLAGKSVIGQMDAAQDAADQHLLLLTPDYLESGYCLHEMRRAIATDPDFSRGKVVPVVLQTCPLPEALGEENAPVRVDLRDDRDPGQWDLLMRSCRADLGVNPLDWLKARDGLVRRLERRESVNLVVNGRGGGACGCR